MTDRCEEVVHGGIMECCACTTYGTLRRVQFDFWPGDVGPGGVCPSGHGRPCEPVPNGDQLAMFPAVTP